MAGESIVQVTSAGTTKLHTWQRVQGANNVEDEVVLIGEPYLPTYTFYAVGIAGSTAAAHFLQIMAGASLPVRIRKVTITPVAIPTGTQRMEFVRLTTAGTGGTALTARPYETGDAAAGATGMTLPTVKGTEGVFLGALTFTVATAVGYLGKMEWVETIGSKPLIIPAGTTNGLAFKTNGLATATYDVVVEFVEASIVS